MRINQMSNSIGMSTLYLNKVTREMNKSAQRISSGKKLNTDLVGDYGKLSAMKGHRNTIKVDTENLHSAYDFASVKDGALSQITELAQKISEAYAKDDFDQGTIDAYASEIESIITNTEFNGNKIFSKDDLTFGSTTIGKSSFVDPDDGSVKLDFTDAAKATTSLNSILSEAGKNGAVMNGIEARISVNTTMASNLDDAISRIEDVDITEENTKYSQLGIQQQISAAMIAKMTESQQSILNFLI